MKFKLLVIFSIIVLGVHFNTSAQDEATLSEQYQNMIESSETFEKYKVIPITKVNAFGDILSDSINSLNQKVTSSQNAKSKAERERDEAKSQMNDLNNKLEEAQNAVDEMPFFGMSMTKVTYNVIMWSIVIILLAGLVIVYIMFLNSFRLTRQAKKDKELVDQEIEDLRKRSHDKQVKIKRELQTALNKLEEYKR
ncbi:hypothetical protein QYS48_33330 [Marivirga arenosa]|uniref:tRNA (Guanine-N1)-methyltransferase n=1 Tax=Marivirga arenosa TaxID=3059076 RepID=A0AA51RAD3_9BACT|nr:hypothetical protein [Marivirga sp. ABR2-2]WMN06683.1 hypothetical protein QYS48_33330 [Marivirga sp. ABR2-2]